MATQGAVEATVELGVEERAAAQVMTVAAAQHPGTLPLT